MIKFRHEIKHYISYSEYLSISQRLKTVVKSDKFANDKGQYFIRSLYFDNYENKAMYEKIAGVNNREKFRIRFYNHNTKFIKLEKKSKINGYTHKVSASISDEECERLLKGDFEFLKNSEKKLFRELFKKIQNQRLTPTTIVDYTREAYVYEPGNVRITFDKDIRTGLFSTEFLSKDLPTIVALFKENPIVLEVKFDEFIPEIITHLIQTNNPKPISVSKYLLCRNYY